MDGRTTLAELVPQRNRAYVALVLGGVVVVALLELAYAAMPWLVPHTTDGRVAALDLDSEGSLCVWFSSFTLLAAAMVCMFVDVVVNGARKSTGRPRTHLWRWAACCWTTMSIDECSSLHEAFKEMMAHLTGERIWHDGTLWWVLAYGLVLSISGCRLLWEMRRCRPAATAFVGVACFYAVAVLAELSWLMAKDVYGVMVEEGCEMLGNLSLLTAMSLYARHVTASFRHARSSPPTIRQARFRAAADEAKLLHIESAFDFVET
jgi:hypothetical protein